MDYRKLSRDLRNCVTPSLVVGTLIHGYSIFKNPEHLQEIYQDFAEGRYLKGTLNTVIPYFLPYSVCLYSRRRLRRENL